MNKDELFEWSKFFVGVTGKLVNQITGCKNQDSELLLLTQELYLIVVDVENGKVKKAFIDTEQQENNFQTLNAIAFGKETYFIGMTSQKRWQLTAVLKNAEGFQESRWDYAWRETGVSRDASEHPMDACFADGIFYVAGKFQDSAAGIGNDVGFILGIEEKDGEVVYSRSQNQLSTSNEDNVKIKNLVCTSRSLWTCAATDDTTGAATKLIDINKANMHDKDDFSELNFNLQFAMAGNLLLVDCAGMEVDEPARILWQMAEIHDSDDTQAYAAMVRVRFDSKKVKYQKYLDELY